MPTHMSASVHSGSSISFGQVAPILPVLATGRHFAESEDSGAGKANKVLTHLFWQGDLDARQGDLATELM